MRGPQFQPFNCNAVSAPPGKQVASFGNSVGNRTAAKGAALRAPCARLRFCQLIADDPVEADVGLGCPDGQAAMKRNAKESCVARSILRLE